MPQYPPLANEELWSDGNWGELLPLVQADWEAAHRDGHLVKEADELGNLGFLHGELGRLQEAVNLHRKELRLRRVLKDSGETVQTLWILSQDLEMAGSLHSAIRCRRIALNYYIGVGEEREIFINASNLGKLFQRMGRWIEALGAFGQALEAHRKAEAHDPRDPFLNGYPGWSEPRILEEMAVIHQAMGDLPSAHDCQFQAAAELHAMAGEELHAADGLVRLGRIQRAGGKEWEASEYFREAMEAFRRLGNIEKAEEARALLGKGRSPKKEFERSKQA